MKNSNFRRSVLCVLATSLALITGCHSGNVWVSSAGPGDAGSSSPASASNPGSVSRTTAPVSGNDPEADRSILYFHRVSIKKTSPFKIVGIGYLDENASSQRAFGVRFPTPEPFKNLPRIQSVQSGVVYARAENLAFDGLFKVSPSSLETIEVARLPRGARSYMFTDNLGKLAWIDAEGAAYLMLPGFQTAQSVDLQGMLGRSIEFVSAAGDVAIHLEAPGRSQDGAYSSTLNLHSPDFSADLSRKLIGFPYALSPYGAKTAVGGRTTGGRVEIRVTGDSPDGTHSIFIGTGGIFDLNWRDEQSLSFRFKSAVGRQFLMLADLLTGDIQTITELSYSAPNGASDQGIACPVWHQGHLYFADSTGSTFAIFRATQTGARWSIEPFARTSSDSEGYICPVTRHSGGSS